MKKFTKKVLPVVLAGALVAGMAMPTMAATDPWSISDVTAKELTYTIDGEDVAIKLYTDYYLEKGGIGKATGSIQREVFTEAKPQDQYENARVNIYVPETATEDSPIIYAVNNSGWLNNIFTEETDGSKLLKESTSANLAKEAMKNGWVVVTAGLRTRGMYDLSTNTYNHAPVTVADAKAVIRYLKHNDAAILGDADKIFVTGTSGGGALTSALAASGNSADYTAELEKIGACMDSTDDILGAIAYCPITDLGHADGAYEFTYANTRKILTNNGFVSNDATLSTESITVSPKLALEYTSYVNGLGIAGSDNTFDTANLKASGTLYNTMKSLLVATLQNAVDTLGVQGFVDTIAARTVITVPQPPMKTTFWTSHDSTYADTLKTAGITIEDGKITNLDMDAYLAYVAMGEVIKPAPAFTNQDLYDGARNENNLFGADADAYGYVSKTVFEMLDAADPIKAKYQTWANYVSKVDVAKQADMTDSIAYLTSSDGDSAPYWWVRHGSVDRDTSFANQTLLYLALKGDSTVSTVDFAFSFNYGHTGDYSVADVEKFVKASVADYDAKQAAKQPTTDNNTTTNGTTSSPKTGDNMLPLFAVVVAAGAVAVASTRRRVVR